MAWRSETFLEFQQLIFDLMGDIQSVDLWNNQIDDYEGDSNLSEHLNLPCVFIEFVGGDWSHEQKRRVAQEYFFRFHLVVEDYQLTNSHNTNQSIAIEHLDLIDTLANTIDLKTLTYAHQIMFVREEIDSSRSHLIHHILDFVATVVDCSLEEATAPDTVEITATEEIVSNQSNIQVQADYNRTNYPTGGYKINNNTYVPPFVNLQPSLIGMNVWLKADTGFFPDTWMDSSSNDNHFVQPDATKRPSLNPTGINNKPSVTFNGNAYMQLLNKVLATNSLTLHIVLKRNGNFVGTYGNAVILSTTNYTTAGTTFLQVNTNAMGANYAANLVTASLDSIITPVDNNPKLITITKAPLGLEIRLNGTFVTSKIGVQNVNGLAHFLGSWLNNYFNGEIAEVIIHNIAQDSVERLKTETYLIYKYSLS